MNLGRIKNAVIALNQKVLVVLMIFLAIGGAVCASHASPILIEHFDREGVIFTGAASALNPNLIPGDIVISNHRLGESQRKPPSAAVQAHKIAFELAFGEDSPYSNEFPDLYKLPYDVNLAITKDVLDQIVGVVLKETHVRQVQLSYRPGGYKDFPVVPSAQLEVEATDEATHAAMNILGYLAQQTTVISSKRFQAGNRRAIQILQTDGANLSNVKMVEEFWHRLGAASPKLQPGFSSVAVDGKPGIYIIDSDGDWLLKDLPKFEMTITRVSKEFRIRTSVTNFPVEYVELGNNWKLHSNGEQYLERFTQRGLGDLRRRLEVEYKPLVHGWIREAFEKHAPEALRRLKDQRQETLRPQLKTMFYPTEKGSRLIRAMRTTSRHLFRKRVGQIMPPATAWVCACL